MIGRTYGRLTVKGLFSRRKTVEQVTEALLNGHPVRICWDCDHRYNENGVAWCRAGKQEILDLVTGERRQVGPDVQCRDARRPHYQCGEVGTLWIQRRSWRQRHPMVNTALTGGFLLLVSWALWQIWQSAVFS